jgi:hypothetical protein
MITGLLVRWTHTRLREYLTQVTLRGDPTRNFSRGTPGWLPHWVFDYGASG